MLSLSGHIKKIAMILIFRPPGEELHEENEKWLQFIMWCVKPLLSKTFVYISKGKCSQIQPLGGADPLVLMYHALFCETIFFLLGILQ